MNPSSPNPPIDIEQFVRDTVGSLDFSDFSSSSLEDRVAALEEIVAARWPRRVILAMRLGKRIRTAVARYDYAGRAFSARRGEQVFIDESVERESRRRDAAA